MHFIFLTLNNKIYAYLYEFSSQSVLHFFIDSINCESLMTHLSALTSIKLSHALLEFSIINRLFKVFPSDYG